MLPPAAASALQSPSHSTFDGAGGGGGGGGSSAKAVFPPPLLLSQTSARAASCLPSSSRLLSLSLPLPLYDPQSASVLASASAGGSFQHASAALSPVASGGGVGGGSAREPSTNTSVPLKPCLPRTVPITQT